MAAVDRAGAQGVVHGEDVAVVVVARDDQIALLLEKTVLLLAGLDLTVGRGDRLGSIVLHTGQVIAGLGRVHGVLVAPLGSIRQLRLELGDVIRASLLLSSQRRLELRNRVLLGLLVGCLLRDELVGLVDVGGQLLLEATEGVRNALDGGLERALATRGVREHRDLDANGARVAPGTRCADHLLVLGVGRVGTSGP